MDCHDGMRILKEEMENLDEKIVSYQMDLITLDLRHNALKFQEEWIEERSQELQNQLAEYYLSKYSGFLIYIGFLLLLKIENSFFGEPNVKTSL